MNTKLAGFLVTSVAFLFAGCASTRTSTTPRVSYPVTYQIQVGNTQVRSDYGPQSLNVNATQEVQVAVGEPFYYQVISPVDVTVYVYERSSPTIRKQVSQMEGMTFNAQIVPNSSPLEFVFSATDPNSRGTLQFTLSDQPIPPRTR